ncbi:translocon-associated protein subunit beta-like [Olea europaea var. sylvestris]|uniref:translocon-associated protein subunit beta-like n=1 Tax=Olea europaea var. sylvestris TaxID=158386 RepID=UPI000C1CFBFB|nr:translocon-associated protein subunit beta-like [Olea europaea var. sylvestris]
MEKAFRLAILAVLALIFVSSPFANASESPFIVAHKRVALKKINSGIERISVSIDVYNRGSATAYDVTLADDSWAQDVFDSVIGNTSKSWERLDAGSLVSHSFELESNVKTIYYGAPALVTYRVLTKSRLQEAYSTPILPLKILSDTESGKMTEKLKKLLVNYGSHISALLIVILFMHMVFNPSKQSGNKKRH